MQIPEQIRRALVLPAASMLVLAGHAHAQTTTLDEGAFLLFVDGREVGRETFTIRQRGEGANAVVTAEARITLDRRDITSTLELAGLRPAGYRVVIDGAEARSITGRVVGGRFSARIVSPSGEMLREYLASDGAVIVDEGVAHHNYFIARAVAEAPRAVPIIVPQQNRQMMAQVRDAGSERIEAGGTTVSARRLVIEPAGGEVRHVWVDARGRVLRVEVPGRNYTAVRAQLPG